MQEETLTFEEIERFRERDERGDYVTHAEMMKKFGFLGK